MQYRDPLPPTGPRLDMIFRRWTWWAWLPLGFLFFVGWVKGWGWLVLVALIAYFGPILVAYIQDRRTG